MTKVKKIVAAAAAAVSISAIGVTASAETILTPPVDWLAVQAQGAPSSVNKTYYYKVFTFGNGYDITCTGFLGDYDRKVEVRKQYYANVMGISNPIDEKVADLHAETYSPIYVANPTNNCCNYITFSFAAKCQNNCNANGVISYHK